MRAWRDVAGRALCAGLLLAQGCSNANATDSPAGAAAAPTTAPAATARAASPAAPRVLDGMPAAETAEPIPASGVWPEASPRSARSDPFWFTDYYMTLDPDLVADVADMRVLPARGETPGPLRYGTGRDYQHVAEPVFSRVYDMCDADDLLAEARFDGPQVAPTLLFRGIIPMMMQQRGLMGCSDLDPEPGEYEPRWVLYGHGGSVSWYYTPEQAREEIARREAAAQKRLAHHLPDGENALGIATWSHSDVVLPLPDQAVDELRVEPESVSVIDGVVRGLVRNWSRELWAYDVSVTLGDDSWDWPLSVQPGEIAPFEIEGWTDELPDPAQFSIDAEFSPEIDVSRAWFATSSPGVRWHWPNGLRAEGYPAELYESLPADEQVLLLHGFALAQFDFPHLMVQKISHQSLAEVAHFVTVPDLRSYVALTPAGEPWPIVDVVRVPLYAVYHFPDVDQVRYIKISRYPFPPVDNARKLGRELEVKWAFHLPDGTQARVWVGGAHPLNAEG